MTPKISYVYIFFGIIAFAFGKPAYKEDSYLIKNENDLNKILQVLADQGKYDISVSQRDDSPKSYYDDKTRYNDEKPSKYYRNDKTGRYYASQENLDRDDEPGTQTLNLYYKKNSGLQKLSEADNDVIEQLLSSLDNENKQRQGKPEEEYDNAEDILAFLSDLQKSLGNDGNYKNQLRLMSTRSRNDDDRDDGDDNRRDRDDDRRDDDRRDRDRNDDRRDRDDDRRDRDDDRKDRNDDRRGKDNLRCRGNNCARDRNARDNLRCRGKSCARSRDDRNDDDRNDRNNRDSLRCRGNKCARTRSDDGDSKLFAKKYKVSDDLDAVVLDISDVDRLLTKLNSPKSQQRSSKQKSKGITLNDIDLDNIIDFRSGNDKKSNVEAVVFDLTQVEDGDVVARQIKRLLSQSNGATEDNYEEYGVEDGYKRGSSNLDKSIKRGRSNSKILAHNENNNNVYVPKWLLDEVISKTNLRDTQADTLKNNMFPLTKLQKERLIKAISNTSTSPKKIFRRHFDHEVGVPFHLEVEGLGQVNP